MHNALRHAEASHISIGLRAADGACRLTLLDDGRGFEYDESEPGGVGQIMRYRVNMIGAKLDIRSQPGQGTEVTCSFPCAASS